MLDSWRAKERNTVWPSLVRQPIARSTSYPETTKDQESEERNRSSRGVLCNRSSLLVPILLHGGKKQLDHPAGKNSVLKE